VIICYSKLYSLCYCDYDRVVLKWINFVCGIDLWYIIHLTGKFQIAVDVIN